MGCCNSRFKDAKDKVNFSQEDGKFEIGQRTINDLITSNMKKRQKSFLAVAQKRLTIKNSDLMYF